MVEGYVLLSATLETILVELTRFKTGDIDLEKIKQTIGIQKDPKKRCFTFENNHEFGMTYPDKNAPFWLVFNYNGDIRLHIPVDNDVCKNIRTVEKMLANFVVQR